MVVYRDDLNTTPILPNHATHTVVSPVIGTHTPDGGRNGLPSTQPISNDTIRVTDCGLSCSQDETVSPHSSSAPQRDERDIRPLQPLAAPRPGQRIARRTKASLKIASLNISGRGEITSDNSRNKWNQVHFYMREEKIGILAVQESHLTPDALASLHALYGRRLLIHHSPDPSGHNKAGVAFVLNKDVTNIKNLQFTELIPGRALFLRSPWHGSESLNIINVYAPNSRADNAAFWPMLNERLQALRLPKPDIMLGDFNITTHGLDRVPYRAHLSQPDSPLQLLLDSHDLFDGWREHNPGTLAYTHPVLISSTHQSRLDRIYATSQLCAASEDWRIEISPVATDHKVVSVKLASSTTPYIGKGRWSVPPALLKDKATLDSVTTLCAGLARKLTELPHRTAECNPQLEYARFKTDLRRTLRKRAKIIQNRVDQTIIRLEEQLDSELNQGALGNTDLSSVAVLQDRIQMMKFRRHQSLKDATKVNVELKSETMSTYWTRLNAPRKPRDVLFSLKTETSHADGSPIFEKRSDRMAELARDYHEKIQALPMPDDPQARGLATEAVLTKIEVKTNKRQRTNLKRRISGPEVRVALASSATGKASGLDGIPYELWKTLLSLSDKNQRNDQAPDLLVIFEAVFNDIHDFGLIKGSSFAEGWMCPIYKNKGDRKDIASYRPITLLNTDYKLLTKIVALRLAACAPKLIHKDQAGFVPGRSIADQIRLTELMISYAEATEENGMIVALDQEKAYDRIDHDYLWQTLKRFDIPEKLTAMIRSLYGQAYTSVAINGEMSSSFKVTRGVRQGDPMSCLLFDLAIEPLAATLRSSDIQGFQIPGLAHKIVTTLFADDTTVYLSQSDDPASLFAILDLWCCASTAKFNTSKTVVIPIGGADFRRTLQNTRRMLPHHTYLDDGPSGPTILADHSSHRILGAHLGNAIDQIKVWAPTVAKIAHSLKLWDQGHPSMFGRRLIVQMVVGGMTQFLATVQGMPKQVEKDLLKILHTFMWSSRRPKIARDTLYESTRNGGLNLLDLESRNDAIEIVWVRQYLNLTQSRPTWAFVADAIMTHHACKRSRVKTMPGTHNQFLQQWGTALTSRGLPNSLKRLLAAAKKFQVAMFAPKPSNKVRKAMPAWLHLGATAMARKLQNSKRANCLRVNHGIEDVRDLLEMSRRCRKPTLFPHHQPSSLCVCETCTIERDVLACTNPHNCASIALQLLEALLPVWRSGEIDHDDNLSLTKRRKAQNAAALQGDDTYTFDPSISSSSISSAFRAFTNPITFIRPSLRPPSGLVIQPASSAVAVVVRPLKHSETSRFACGIVWGPNLTHQEIFSLSPTISDACVAYLAGLLVYLSTYPPFFPLTVVAVPDRPFHLLASGYKTRDDLGWPSSPVNEVLGPLVSALRSRSAPFSLTRETPAVTALTIGQLGLMTSTQGPTAPVRAPITSFNFALMPTGICLPRVTQASAYQRIRAMRSAPQRRKSRLMVEQLIANLPASTRPQDIWRAVHHPDIRRPIRAFLWKSLHSAHSVGEYWNHIPGRESFAECPICRVPESLEHILLECSYPPRKVIWNRLRHILVTKSIETTILTWPNLLTCGLLFVGRKKSSRPGASRLLRIVVSESVYLIWKLRCERRMQFDNDRALWPSTQAVNARWNAALDARLTLDRLTSNRQLQPTRLPRELLLATWSGTLHDEYLLPEDWANQPRVLVGRGPPDRITTGD